MTDRFPTASELAIELRRRAGGNLAHNGRSFEVIRTPVDHTLIDAADLLEHMALHLKMIAHETQHHSPTYLQEQRAAFGLRWAPEDVKKLVKVSDGQPDD